MTARWLALLLAAPLLAGAETGARLAADVQGIELDAGQCYRIRELAFQRGDARFYLTDGYLIFGKPVGGRLILAAFYAPGAMNDAELLLRPPDRGERASLAAYTGAPNLNEHFRAALFVVTDGSLESWLAGIRESPLSRVDREMGLLMNSRFAGAARNLGMSFQVRLVHDLLNNEPGLGMFYAAISGTRLGNFDFFFDPTAREEITVGAVVSMPAGPVFNTWMSFETRERQREKGEPPQLGRLSDFRIEATVHPDLRLEAHTRATWTPTRAIRGALGFEIDPQMEVTSVLLDGQPVEVFRRESLRASLIGGHPNDAFVVVLPEPMAPGRAYEFEFAHQGRVISDAGNRVYYVGARTSWYPSRGWDYATFDLRFRVQENLQLVATGELVSETVEGGWRHVHRRAASPVRLAGFNLGEFDSLAVKKGGIAVEVFANRRAESALQPRTQAIIIPARPYVAPDGTPVRRQPQIIALPAPPPPDPRARMKHLAEEVSSAMEWMSAQFGPPPLPLLTVSPIPGYFGQGFPGLLYLSTLAFVSESARPAVARSTDQQTFYEEILSAHEAAHQWWGNLVATSSYRDEWLQEALANYTALMVLERRKGPRALENVLSSYNESLRRVNERGYPVESTGPITWGSRLQTGGGTEAWRVITYDKGSWIIHMLRRRLGDASFLKMLRTLRDRYQYGAISTEEFRELCAEFLPPGIPDRQLIDFFDHWVYGIGIPVLSINYSVKGQLLSVTVRQSGVPEDFGVDLPVEVRVTGRRQPIVKWIRTDAIPVQFTMTLPGPLQRVELAPGYGVLAVR